jgi:hypothetical protein
MVTACRLGPMLCSCDLLRLVIRCPLLILAMPKVQLWRNRDVRHLPCLACARFWWQLSGKDQMLASSMRSSGSRLERSRGDRDIQGAHTHLRTRPYGYDLSCNQDVALVQQWWVLKLPISTCQAALADLPPEQGLPQSSHAPGTGPLGTPLCHIQTWALLTGCTCAWSHHNGQPMPSVPTHVEAYKPGTGAGVVWEGFNRCVQP